jgi:branched-chain amino acid transport system permease protein
MSHLALTLSSGLSQGLIFSLVALAIVLIYRSMGFINFAIGDVALSCVFIAFHSFDSSLPIWIILLTSIMFAAVINPLLHLILFQPMQRQAKVTSERQIALSLEVLSFAIIMLNHGLLVYFFTEEQKTFERLFKSDFFNIVLILVLLLGLQLGLQRGRLGLWMRATFSNQRAASFIGVPVSSVKLASWGLSGMTATLAAFIYAGQTSLHPETMSPILIYGFSAAVVGGLSSFSGSVIAGLSIGVFDVLIGTYGNWIANDLRFPFVFLLLVVILIWKPEGIFGKKIYERL